MSKTLETGAIQIYIFIYLFITPIDTNILLKQFWHCVNLKWWTFATCHTKKNHVFTWPNIGENTRNSKKCPFDKCVYFFKDDLYSAPLYCIYINYSCAICHIKSISDWNLSKWYSVDVVPQPYQIKAMTSGHLKTACSTSGLRGMM